VLVFLLQRYDNKTVTRLYGLRIKLPKLRNPKPSLDALRAENISRRGRLNVKGFGVFLNFFNVSFGVSEKSVIFAAHYKKIGNGVSLSCK